MHLFKQKKHNKQTPHTQAKNSHRVLSDQRLNDLLKEEAGSASSVQKTIENYYVILAANNELYDDFGEELSLEKISKAIERRAEEVNICVAEDEEIKSQFRARDVARYLTSAALIKIKSDATGFNPSRYAVVSCSIFKMENNNAQEVEVHKNQKENYIKS